MITAVKGVTQLAIDGASMTLTQVRPDWKRDQETRSDSSCLADHGNQLNAIINLLRS